MPGRWSSARPGSQRARGERSSRRPSDGSPRAASAPRGRCARHGRAIDLAPEAFDVAANAACETQTCSGTTAPGPREAGAAHGLVDGRASLRALPARARTFRVGDDDEHERPRERLPDQARRLVRQEPADVTPPIVTPTGDRRRGGGRLDRRLGRAAARSAAARSWAGLVSSARVPAPRRSRRARTRPKSPRERRLRAKPAPYRAYAQFHVVSVDTNVDGSFVTTASTPATTTRAKSRDRRRSMRRPTRRERARRVPCDGVTSSCLRTSTVARVTREQRPTSSGVRRAASAGRGSDRPAATRRRRCRRSSGNDAPARMSRLESWRGSAVAVVEGADQAPLGSPKCRKAPTTPRARSRTSGRRGRRSRAPRRRRTRAPRRASACPAPRPG